MRVAPRAHLWPREHTCLLTGPWCPERLHPVARRRRLEGLFVRNGTDEVNVKGCPGQMEHGGPSCLPHIYLRTGRGQYLSSHPRLMLWAPPQGLELQFQADWNGQCGGLHSGGAEARDPSPGHSSCRMLAIPVPAPARLLDGD